MTDDLPTDVEMNAFQSNRRFVGNGPPDTRSTDQASEDYSGGAQHNVRVAGVVTHTAA